MIEEVEGWVRRAGSEALEEVVDELVEEGNRRGAPDNITVAFLTWRPPFSGSIRPGSSKVEQLIQAGPIQGPRQGVQIGPPDKWIPPAYLPFQRPEQLGLVTLRHLPVRQNPNHDTLPCLRERRRGRGSRLELPGPRSSSAGPHGIPLARIGARRPVPVRWPLRS